MVCTRFRLEKLARKFHPAKCINYYTPEIGSLEGQIFEILSIYSKNWENYRKHGKKLYINHRVLKIGGVNQTLMYDFKYPKT